MNYISQRPLAKWQHIVHKETSDYQNKYWQGICSIKLSLCYVAFHNWLTVAAAVMSLHLCNEAKFAERLIKIRE